MITDNSFTSFLSNVFYSLSREVTLERYLITVEFDNEPEAFSFISQE